MTLDLNTIHTNFSYVNLPVHVCLYVQKYIYARMGVEK